jgi:hypothetical protein
MGSLIRGIDRRPYVEVENYQETESKIAKAAAYAALSFLGLRGVQFAAQNVHIKIDPSKLSYLHEGLSTPGNEWWKVAGLELDSDGKAPVRLKDFFLEGVKRTEETLGGIPRTFGVFGYASRDVFTSPATRLSISPDDLLGAEPHYRALMENAGEKLKPSDMLRGLEVAPHQGKLGLFGKTASGELEASPLVSDVDVQVRRWSPEGAPDRFNHRIRDADIVTEFMGGTKIRGAEIGESNPARFMVSKASGDLKITGITREFLEPFGDVTKMEERLSANLPEGAHKGIRDAHVFAKRMSERYMRILDAPLEFYEELIHGGPGAEGGLLKKAQSSSAYGFFKNLLGTGGDYSGSVIDLWARHAGRIGLVAGGLALGYEAGSAITNLFLDKNVAQVGAEVVGAAQRTYAATSDLTGLTALGQYQEEQAPGSSRMMAHIGFGLSGFLTGHMVASATAPLVKEAGEFGWRAAREEIHELPSALKRLEDTPLIGNMFKGAKTRGGRFGAIGAVVGGLLAAPFALGSLGSSKSYDETLAEQSGETEVAVRKGAYWEMGRTDIEGEGIDYYRPGWFARAKDDAFGDLQHDEYADRPFSRFIKGLIDPYWREKKFYYERPYPVTGPETSGFGPLGTLWGATVGRVLKNPAYMHTDELGSGGTEGADDGEVIQYGTSVSDAPEGTLGGLGPTPAASPYSASFLGGEAAYKATEAAGLPGFVFTAIKKAITGEQDFGTEDPVLESFSQMGSVGDNYWDLNIGGGFGTTEAFRRIFPNERFQLQKVNPIANEMPDWMPGAEYFNDFQHGDPYASIQEGEYRLPGSGYESRFPELEGTSLEDYPDIHKYRILADVAPYSKQFKDVSQRMDSMADSNQLSDQDEMLYRATRAETEEKSRKVPFGEHKGIIGGYWEMLKKVGRANPVEHLIPLSPVHKFAGALDPISEYESKNVYSVASPSWGDPLDDFVAPAVTNAARMFGYDGIPQAESQRRELTGYFDKLEFMKYKKLEGAARAQDDGSAAFAYARKAEYTMYGADPYGTVDSIMKSLPREEKPFFKDFIAAETSEEKGRILELVPEYTKKFYLGQWQKQIHASLAAKGDLSSDEVSMVQQIEAARALEGESSSRSTWGEYQSEVASGSVRANTFPDFIRGKRLGGYFDDESPLDAPPTDWLGYDPAIAMDDVKLRVVENLGLDHHDFNIWEDDVAMARRKPYLDVAAEELLQGKAEERDYITKSLQQMELHNLDVQIVATGGNETRIVFDIDADRSGQLASALERAGVRYGT